MGGDKEPRDPAADVYAPGFGSHVMTMGGRWVMGSRRGPSPFQTVRWFHARLKENSTSTVEPIRPDGCRDSLPWPQCTKGKGRNMG